MTFRNALLFCIEVLSLSKELMKKITVLNFLEMEEFFLRSKLFFLLQSLEQFVVQISNSNHGTDFVSVGYGFEMIFPIYL